MTEKKKFIVSQKTLVIFLICFVIFMGTSVAYRIVTHGFE